MRFHLLHPLLLLVASLRLLPSVEAATSKVAAPRTFNFENDISPLLTRYSCNASPCHGKAEGQNGFKLSVFGYDALADWRAFVTESKGRRSSSALPEQSLFLAKASGTLPHQGGARIPVGSPDYETIRAWLAAGAPFGSTNDARVVKVELEPREKILTPGAKLQLRVNATYSDGRKGDVTRFCVFQSNNDSLAKVDEHGAVVIGSLPGQTSVMARYLGEVTSFMAIVPRPGKPVGEAGFAEFNFIDRHVNAHLKKLNLRPSDVCDDATFLRRAHLDIIGTLPTADEARRFLADPAKDKRARLVNALLVRPEFADFWALKWSDLLRVDRQKLGQRDAYAYYRWIREQFAANRPLDQFARALLTAEGPLDDAPAGHFYKVVSKPGEMANAVSQVFLGVRIACAECHHHPFDRWSQTDYYGMSGLFAQVSIRKGALGETLLAEGNPTTKHPRTGENVPPHALDAAPVMDTGDRRRALAEWFTAPENPWFARNLANRLVAHFFGRGIVEPVDDVRATNPAGNPALLDAVAKSLVDARFDLQQFIRTLTASRTYQLSATPNDTNAQDEQNFSRALFKRLPAEVLLDAVCDVTGVPEKFDGVPAGTRAVQLWDSQAQHYFLKLFGRPVRVTACECERNAEASIAQVLHLLNSPNLQSKLSHADGQIARLVAAHADNAKLAEALYLTFFSRLPTEAERQLAVKHLAASPNRQQAAEDFAWSLLNAVEFVFNH
ncbi:MAG: DUF1549 domain-containing protein [Proteobacteria bacterium]|nr:DUF1549 domain-containing protein [Verrucomicrobiota bacterium]NBU08050.1 DUF1549 domain-containing protein [Pseudomonadota bacterium]